MEKMTNVKALNFVIENADLPEDVLAKVTAIRDGFVKKAENKKPTKVQEANEVIKTAIVEFLKGVDKARATEVANAGIEGVESTQKATAMLKALVAEGKVVKETDKKAVFWKVAEQSSATPCKN